MPFGKYKGTPMEQVPASYLHWLWREGKYKEVNTNDVADYIHRSLSALAQELPDAIWEDT